MKQSTIARPVAWEGLGLHSGVPVRVGLVPAPPDSGIVFVRSSTGEEPGVEIPACHRHLRASSRATTLGANPDLATATGEGGREARVSMVEHLLATLYALDIDNVRIRVDAPELPAMDGSALPLVDRVKAAGRELLGVDRVAITLKEPVEIRDGDRWIRAEPARSLGVSYSIDFDHPLIGRQSLEVPEFDAEYFARELAAARTFGFVHEVEALRIAGLAHGCSLENTLVLDDDQILNEGGLRFRDEFVRHKVIDLLGDLALLGAPLHAHVSVEKGGHSLHHRLVRAIAETGS